MKFPRDINGGELAKRLEKYGYQITRQTGSHLRLTSHLGVSVHHITIPVHGHLKIGTFSSILNEVARYLEKDKDTVLEELFG